MSGKTIQEKIPPRYYSYAATGIGLLACIALWVAGAGNPRRFTATMAINHHSAYGSQTNCYTCHVPEGSATTAMITSMDCTTGGCHRELQRNVSDEEAMQRAVQVMSSWADAKPRAEHYLSLHKAVKGWPCVECHTEHTNRPTKYPDGWGAYQPAAQSSLRVSRETYVSLADYMQERQSRAAGR